MEDAEGGITAIMLMTFIAIAIAVGLCCTASVVCGLSGMLFAG